jgi:hypothetical protein
MMTTNAARMQSFLDAKAPDAKLTMVELKQAGVQIHAAIAEMLTYGIPIRTAYCPQAGHHYWLGNASKKLVAQARAWTDRKKHFRKWADLIADCEWRTIEEMAELCGISKPAMREALRAMSGQKSERIARLVSYTSRQIAYNRFEYLVKRVHG